MKRLLQLMALTLCLATPVVHAAPTCSWFDVEQWVDSYHPYDEYQQTGQTLKAVFKYTIQNDEAAPVDFRVVFMWSDQYGGIGSATLLNHTVSANGSYTTPSNIESWLQIPSLFQPNYYFVVICERKFGTEWYPLESVDLELMWYAGDR